MFNQYALLLPFRDPLPAAIWLDTSDHFSPFPLRVQKLRQEVYADISKELSEAKTYFKQNKWKQAKKRVVNSIRNIRFAMQVMKYGKVIHLGETNELSNEIMSEDFKIFSSLKDFQTWHQPLIDLCIKKCNSILPSRHESTHRIVSYL